MALACPAAALARPPAHPPTRTLGHPPSGPHAKQVIQCVPLAAPAPASLMITFSYFKVTHFRWWARGSSVEGHSYIPAAR